MDDSTQPEGSLLDTQTGVTQTDSERTAVDIARYALAAHAAHKPLRRDALRSLFRDTSARHFKLAFSRADELLQLHFGLTLAPYPAHEKSLDAPAQTKPLEQDDAQLMGFAAAVLSLVLVSNMCVTMDQLVLYVRKLGPPAHIANAPASRLSTTDDAQRDACAREAINALQRRGYLDVLAPRAAPEDVELTWGPQAKVDFRPIDIARFIAATTGQECSPEFVAKIGRAFGRNIEG
ncbi:hypothetical protein DL89DRAFT_289774 [Linderina pennispora]|uniref:MAGE domain-containing protein n=1 Tax=Linderina pennispora TaxID=61395 RepID=A0A1Y1WKZ7_9FUNG|nr:uncharacterized protein DL89DRAFT_289774 [Linderina pennispora]ORX74153.1 hypothetical protein DL89DRAFT_289774 [Linderina pennispora]